MPCAPPQSMLTRLHYFLRPLPFFVLRASSLAEEAIVTAVIDANPHLLEGGQTGGPQYSLLYDRAKKSGLKTRSLQQFRAHLASTRVGKEEGHLEGEWLRPGDFHI